MDAFYPEELQWEQPASQVGCSGGGNHALGQRTQSDPSDSGYRLVYVYLLPAGASDLKWDVPKLCSNGTILRSPLHWNYWNSMVWLAKETNVASYPVGHRHRRYDTAVKTYTNGSSTKTLPEIVFVSSVDSLSTWNCWNPIRKLDEVEQLLATKGLNDASYKYQVLLHAKQDPACTPSVYENWVGLAGIQYSYSLTHFPSANPASSIRGLYGCANRIADPVIMHEATHTLGADHLTCCTADIMYDGSDPSANSLASNSGTPEYAFDHGVAQYRDVVLDDAYDIDAADYITREFHLCN